MNLPVLGIASDKVCPFASDLFHLARLQRSPLLEYVSGFHLMAEYYCIVCIYSGSSLITGFALVNWPLSTFICQPLQHSRGCLQACTEAVRFHGPACVFQLRLCPMSAFML